VATPDGRRNLNLWTTNITQPDENKTLNRSRLLTQTTLRDFAELWPGKFRNETNGVSPRRFLLLANPRLSGLITARLGDQRWLTDLDRLAELEAFAGDEEFRAQWREVKQLNKADLASYALAATGVAIDPGSLYDVMAKRLHEYKRQLLKLLHVVTVYNRIKADPAAVVTPRTVIFAAKAAPSYQQAKRIIKLTFDSRLAQTDTLAWIHRRDSCDGFPAGGLGLLILRLSAGVVFLPLTVVRLVRESLPGMGSGGLPWAAGPGDAVTGSGLVRPLRRAARWRRGTGWPIPARGASLRAGAR